ncbi:MAG TPA: POTRA domain-containing protein, partial [Treponemataceae bacterium]|nr:POTRA domain-containing protein [Treponemataceae bacterium]
MRTKLIALALALFCTCGLIAQTADTWYLNKPIRGIVYVGLRNVDKAELEGLFPSIVGKKFTDELYWDVLQKLYALEYFSDISPVALPADTDRESVILQFTVKERPVVKRIRIVGNDRVRAADILDKVSLKEGDIYNEMKGRLDERAVRDFYIEKGYATATVSVETKQVSDGLLDFIIKVVEGRQTVVSSISFEGNTIIPTKTLRGELQLKEAKLITAGVFQEALLVADKEGIRRYYAERGYIDARV